MPDDLAPDDAGDLVLIGVIAGAHGVKGELKVNLETDFPDRFKHLRTVYTGKDHVPVRVESARRLGDRVAIRLADCTDRDAAQALRGTLLSIPSRDLMPLPAHTYYRDQIVGLQVVTTAGDALGTITEILVTGSNDVYVVRDEQRETLIPALKEIVREVDVTGGRMVIEPVDGLL
ncbi:MAG: ribosome maturation factor RimM [Chloroflexota bacterium]